MRPKCVADHALIAADVRFHQRTPVIAGRFLPTLTAIGIGLEGHGRNPGAVDRGRGLPCGTAQPNLSPSEASGRYNPDVLLFSILAVVTGCNSYRGIVTFIDVNRRKLNAAFGLKWRREPAHTAIRYILKG